MSDDDLYFFFDCFFEINCDFGWGDSFGRIIVSGFVVQRVGYYFCFLDSVFYIIDVFFKLFVCFVFVVK